jgi:hypothetical protein
MEACAAHKASLTNVTPDEIARKHWVHGHPTLTHQPPPRPFTQEIAGSNPAGGTGEVPVNSAVLTVPFENSELR